MPARQHVEMWRGESRTLTLHARDAVNLPYDLTGKTVTLYVDEDTGDGARLTRTAQVPPGTGGAFTVDIAAGDTGGMEGDFHYSAYAEQGGSRTMVCDGRFRIWPAVRP